MIRWLKKHFIPHRGNNHRPHFLRAKAMIVVAIAALAVEGAVVASPFLALRAYESFLATIVPGLLSDLTNRQREKRQLPELVTNPLLQEAAQLKAQDMAEKGYFAHTSPDGLTPWHWLQKVGYRYTYAGENLAVNFSDSEDVTKAWMNSPTHRENIVKGMYTEIGTGMATGMYKGKKSIYVVQVYASPKQPLIASPNIPAARPAPKSDVSQREPEREAESLQENLAQPEPIQISEITQEIPQQPAALERAVASPLKTANMIYLSIAGIIAGTLLVKLLVQMRVHHLDLVGNALVVLALVGALYASNLTIVRKPVELPDDRTAAAGIWSEVNY